MAQQAFLCALVLCGLLFSSQAFRLRRQMPNLPEIENTFAPQKTLLTDQVIPPPSPPASAPATAASTPLQENSASSELLGDGTEVYPLGLGQPASPLTDESAEDVTVVHEGGELPFVQLDSEVADSKFPNLPMSIGVVRDGKKLCPYAPVGGTTPNSLKECAHADGLCCHTINTCCPKNYVCAGSLLEPKCKKSQIEQSILIRPVYHISTADEPEGLPEEQKKQEQIDVLSTFFPKEPIVAPKPWEIVKPATAPPILTVQVPPQPVGHRVVVLSNKNVLNHESELSTQAWKQDKTGETCTGDSDCGNDLYCLVKSTDNCNEKICTPYSKAGEPCGTSFVSTTCPRALRCNAMSTCTTILSQQGTCRDINNLAAKSK